MMTEQIKLTADDIKIEQHMNGYYLRFFDKKFNKSETNIIQLKQQILEHQEFVNDEKGYANFLQLDFDIMKDKAEKYDELDKPYNENIMYALQKMEEVNKLLQEKLENIKELLNRSYLYSNTSIFESKIKEILGDKK
jgi:hypothetical protein